MKIQKKETKQTLSFRLSNKLREELKKIADKNKVSITVVIEKALELFISKEVKK